MGNPQRICNPDIPPAEVPNDLETAGRMCHSYLPVIHQLILPVFRTLISSCDDSVPAAVARVAV